MSADIIHDRSHQRSHLHSLLLASSRLRMLIFSFMRYCFIRVQQRNSISNPYSSYYCMGSSIQSHKSHIWAFLSTLPAGTVGGSGASKLSKFDVSRGFFSLGLRRLNHLCCLISRAPVGPDPSRLSGLTCIKGKCHYC